MAAIGLRDGPSTGLSGLTWLIVTYGARDATIIEAKRTKMVQLAVQALTVAQIESGKVRSSAKFRAV